MPNLPTNLKSSLALVLAAAAFINSLLPSNPIAFGAPNQQAATDAAVVQPAQTAQPVVAAQADQPSITLEGAAVASTVPQFIGYQGMLRDGEGKPITGQVNVTFRLYDNVTKPVDQRLWEEKQSSITVRDGRFSVLLGNVSNPITPTLITSPDRFIGVQVDGYQEMQPRQKFSSVPFAMWAERAASLSAPDGNPLSAVYVDNNGSVGIGTENPTHKFHVVAQDAVGLFESSGSQAYLRLSTNEGFNNRVELANRPGGRLALWVAGIGDVFNITRNGLIGLGTNNPIDRFHFADGRVRFSKAESQGYATSFFIDTVSTTAAELHTEGAPISINSKNNWLGINFWDGTGDVNIGNGSNRLNVNGNLTVGGRKPIFFQRFSNLGDEVTIPTDILVSEYNCGIAGWAATSVDIQENNGGNYIAETFQGDHRWWIKAHYYSQGDHENWFITLICVDTRLSEIRGDPFTR